MNTTEPACAVHKNGFIRSCCFCSLRRDGSCSSDQRRKWYKGICNFSEVDLQPNLLVCWLAGDTAAIADQLDEEEVRIWREGGR